MPETDSAASEGASLAPFDLVASIMGVMKSGDRKRYVRYDFSLVAYTDILGFEEFVKERTPDTISKTLRIFREIIDPNRFKSPVSEIPRRHFRNFSDLCIVAIPINNPRQPERDAVFEQLLHLIHASMRRHSHVEQMLLEMLEDQLPKIRDFRVGWYGGEPLLGKKVLLRLSDAFIERCERAQVGYSAHITTNGYLLDQETCSELRDRRVQNAQIGLDGPPIVHNQMRPLAGGKDTFWQILHNLRHAIDYMDVSVRVNVDKENFGHSEELLQILAAEGFAGKLSVYPAQIVAVNTMNCNILPIGSWNHPPGVCQPPIAMYVILGLKP